jgi:hypothetical protein
MVVGLVLYVVVLSATGVSPVLRRPSLAVGSGVTLPRVSIPTRISRRLGPSRIEQATAEKCTGETPVARDATVRLRIAGTPFGCSAYIEAIVITGL